MRDGVPNSVFKLQRVVRKPRNDVALVIEYMSAEQTTKFMDDRICLQLTTYNVGPQTIAKLDFNSTSYIWFMVLIIIVAGVYKATDITFGGPTLYSFFWICSF